jgi:DNA-binding HxlR family transcriptional regulator
MAGSSSPLSAAVDKVGDRWTLLIVDALLGGPARFNQLQDSITGISTNVLSQRLKHLEQQGLVVAELYSARPARHVYALSSAGHELSGALRLLAAWGAAHGDDVQTPAHLACGTPVEPRWFCPTCDVRVDDPDDEPLRFV